MAFKDIVRDVLMEYSSELRLPFDDDYFKNKNYLEQYKDWLEDFGKYGSLPPSRLDFWSEAEKAVKVIVGNKMLQDYNRYFNGGLSYDKLLKKFKSIVGNNLIVGNGNNIYVERQVVIDGFASSYDDSDKNGKDSSQFYKSLVDFYNGNVGGCWTYKDGNAESYCSMNSGDVITLKGFIRVDDIDFVQTIFLNIQYHSEHEIRVKPNAKIELHEVVFNNEYKIPLKGNLIVSATYFGDNIGYNGEYAIVNDEFGKYGLMDRNGNILSAEDAFRKALSKGIAIDEIADGFQSFGDGMRVGDFHGKCFLVDDNGNIVGDSLFDSIRHFDDGLYMVRKDGKCAIVNKQGENAINGNEWFDEIYSFDKGYAKVIKGGFYSFIDKNCNLIANGNLWIKNGIVSMKLNSNYFYMQYNSRKYMFDVQGQFYDYYTEEPIKSPFEVTNENKSFISKILREEIVDYLKCDIK